MITAAASAFVLGLALASNKPLLVLPLVGELSTASGNRFTSTLQNQGDSSRISYTFHPSGGNEGRTAESTAARAAAPWQRKSALGAVEIANADGASVVIRHLDASGRMIGSVTTVAEPETAAMREGDLVTSTFPGEGWRTNLAIFESANRAAAVLIEALDSSGQTIAREERTLKPHEQRLLPLASGATSVRVRVLRGPGRIHIRAYSTNGTSGALHGSVNRITRDAGPRSGRSLMGLAVLAVVLVLIGRVIPESGREDASKES